MIKKLIIILLLNLIITPITLAKSVTILSTNDLHGRLNSANNKITNLAARRTTLLKQYPNSLILDAGDFAQGTLYFKLLDENLNLKILEIQNYNAITLGNHEFDKGTEYIKKSAKSVQLPLLASNIKFSDKELDNLIKDYVIKEINGIKIGIIGVLDRTVKVTTSVNPDLYKAYDEIKTLKKIVKKLDKKTDLIIILSHCGIDKDKIIAKEVEGIDLIIGGHSHTYLEKPIKVKQKNNDKVLISQNGEFGAIIGKWDIEVENDKIKNYNFNQIPINEEIFPDEKILKLIKKYDKEIGNFSSQIAGYSKTKIDARREAVRTNLSTAGGLLHQAIKNRFPEVEISANTAGGYRYSGFLPNEIKNKDIEELFPFDSYLVILKVKGKDIKSMLESSSRFLPKPSGMFLQTSGVSYTVDLKKQPQILNEDLTKIIKKGKRVKNIKVNGKPLNMNQYYTFATDNFMYFGGDGYIQFKKYKNVKHTNLYLDKILIEYLNKNSPVEINIEDKMEIEK